MFRVTRSPQRRHTLALVGLAGLAWGALSLPGMHEGEATWLDDLFTAVSAVTTTGLTTVGTAPTYTGLGEAVILAFIQLGGLGYMGLLAFVVLWPGRRIDERDDAVVSEDQNLGDDVDVSTFVRRVLAFTAVVEGIGAVVLAFGFWRLGLPPGEAAWKGLFHSVSAFCTAGFALQTDSLRGYSDDPLIAIAAISVATLGSLGFILFTAVRKRFRGGDGDYDRATVAVFSLFALILVSYSVMCYFAGGPTRDTAYPWLNSIFLAATALTGTGYSTVPTGELPTVLLMALIIPISLGASPAGTTGGMKLSNVALLGKLVYQRLRGRVGVDLGGEEAEPRDVHEAVGVVALYLTFLVVGGLALAAVVGEAPPPMDFDAVFFEAASALGNTGLSCGITADLGGAARGILMALMLAGRIGAMTLAYSLVSTREEAE